MDANHHKHAAVPQNIGLVVNLALGRWLVASMLVKIPAMQTSVILVLCKAFSLAYVELKRKIDYVLMLLGSAIRFVVSAIAAATMFAKQCVTVGSVANVHPVDHEHVLVAKHLIYCHAQRRYQHVVIRVVNSWLVASTFVLIDVTKEYVRHVFSSE